ncbi:MAG: tetratricopeptide repeat protein [Candidatus Poribacteria bacterium]|nr:tetratricopeptide repeat protein [Candidatus Poribacteria bacterium]
MTPNEIYEFVGKIHNKSKSGDYIYRGEPKLYEKVSSNLYRRMEETGLLEIGLEEIRSREMEDARNYVKGTDFEIRSRIQHYGGRTNLIDFTKNYYVALFFACERFHSEPGRVILQDRNGAIKDYIMEPQNVEDEIRIKKQESIFIDPPDGFIESDSDDVFIFEIPAEYKRPMLKHLESVNKSAKTIYPDLHGFIRSQEIRWESYVNFKKASGYRAKGGYGRAINHFSKSIELTPNYASAYNNRGTVYTLIYERDKAINAFENGIIDFNEFRRLKPDDDTAYYNIGHLYHEKGDYDNAIGNYMLAKRLNPDRDEARRNLIVSHNNRAAFYFKDGYIDAAIIEIKRVIALNPNCAAYNLLGNCYLQKDMLDNAIQNFDKAIKLNPNNADAYNNRGYAHFLNDDHDKAIKDFEEATRTKPYYATGYNRLGWVYFINNDHDSAIDNYNKAIKAKPSYARAYNNRGVLHYTKREYPESIRDYNKAIESDRNNPAFYKNRRLAYIKIGDHTKAEQDRNKANEFEGVRHALFLFHSDNEVLQILL